MSPPRQTSAAAIGVSRHKCQSERFAPGKKRVHLTFRCCRALDERTFSPNGRVIVCRTEISLEEFADVHGVGFSRIALKIPPSSCRSFFPRSRFNCFILLPPREFASPCLMAAP